MTPKLFRAAARVALGLVAYALAAGTAAAQQATTTGTVRGIVSAPDGSPINGANVIAINSETGVRRGAIADDRGRYNIPFLDPGTYVLRAQFIGFRPTERPGVRISLGQVEVANFQLEQSAVTLAETRIVADETPLIETTKTGTSTRIGQEQIAQMPVNGRNFKDLVVLAPGTSDQGNLGSGGGQSIGGRRTGASNILMDGVNNNESFFGGDARGGDRAPFSYSIEAIKEIQVITAGYDVERGSYTGGTVNAVTKSGTNSFEGAGFGYLRQDKLGGFQTTGRDFFGRDPIDFKSQQYGAFLGGPLIKDRMHFFVSLDGQRRDQPVYLFGSRATDDIAVRAAGIHPDTVDALMQSALDLYGYDLSAERGQSLLKTDQSAFFGRLDWQINDNHKVVLRDNFTSVDVVGDRISVSQTSTDFASNGGNNKDKSNSFVASLFSTFGRGFSNEFRAQYATENKPRPSNPSGQFGVPLPQVIVRNVPSTLSTGQTVLAEVRFGADPVLHANLLDQKTTEIINNVRWVKDDHTFKLGANYLKVDVFNRFWNNSLGTFTFNSLSDFQNGIVGGYTRTLGLPGRTIPVQDFAANEAAVYAQDEWQVTPKLFLTYGLRYDYAWFPVEAPSNALLKNSFPYLDTKKQPIDNNNISPRLGFTFDPGADGVQVIRGGTGFFYGRSPYVLYGNALGATGGGTLSLNCSAAGASPLPDFAQYAEDRSTIPTACLGAGAAQPAPQIVVFDEGYEQPRAWKSNLAYDRLVAGSWRVTLEQSFMRIDDNYIVQDDNLAANPAFTIEGRLPVYVDASRINTGSAAISRGETRRDNNFDQVFVHRSKGQTISSQSIVQLTGRNDWGSMYLSYTYDRTRDNGSIPCCITGSMFGFTRPAGDPNNYNDQWGPAAFARTHSIVVAPTFNLPYGISGSAILRAFSGLPWTPRYGGDINGDGEINDRLYVPRLDEVSGYLFTGNSADEQARKRSQFEQLIENTACLRENRGRTIGRNACENPWNYLVDARVSRKFRVVREQSIEVQADFFNVLNGISDKWGRRMQVNDDRTAGDDRFLIPRQFDATQRKFRYDVNPTAGKATPSVNFPLSQFQMQLGLRYNF